jgi:GNAT superfamily N-acetyltransferase
VNIKLHPKKDLATIGFFKNYPVVEYLKEKSSALILGKSNELWAFLISSNADELSEILAKYHSKTRYFSSVEDWMIPLILKHGSADWILTTNRYILEESTVLDLPEPPLVAIGISFAAYIHKHSDYKAFTSVSYIEERLSKGISAGFMVNNKLVAWGLTHDDGSLGFLQVLDAYRNKGLGQQILLKLIQQKRGLKEAVFGNVIPENLVSKHLIEKLGFEIDRKMSWLKLKKYGQKA